MNSSAKYRKARRDEPGASNRSTYSAAPQPAAASGERERGQKRPACTAVAAGSAAANELKLAAAVQHERDLLRLPVVVDPVGTRIATGRAYGGHPRELPVQAPRELRRRAVELLRRRAEHRGAVGLQQRERRHFDTVDLTLGRGRRPARALHVPLARRIEAVAVAAYDLRRLLRAAAAAACKDERDGCPKGARRGGRFVRPDAG